MSFDHDLDEAWLQALLDQFPEILPVTSVDPRISTPLLSLGREIATQVGPIDNLFLSRSGHLVLVETKLWRNPEARRQVVAQTLDYASQARRWDYERIQGLFDRRHGNDASCWEVISPEEEEHEWIDRVNRNLEAGRMLLLVVGDGIRSQVHDLAAAVDGSPDFLFRLALVEVRPFELEDGRVLAVPHVQAQTREIERAVVRIVFDEGKRPDVDIAVPHDESTEGRGSGTLSAEELQADLASGGPEGEEAAKVADHLLRLLEPADLVVQWKSGSFTIHGHHPTDHGTMLSLGVVERSGNFYAYLPWLRDQLARTWEDEDVVQLVIQAQGDLLRDVGCRQTKSGTHWTTELANLAGREAELVEGLQELMRRIGEEASKLRANALA